MKIRYFFTCLMLFSFLNINAQQVPEVQQSLITKVTANWCSLCGTWGWTFYEDILADNDDKAVILTAHHSGDLTSGVGASFQTNFETNSQPRFIVGNQDQAVISSSIEAKRTQIKDLVDANYASSPVANTGMDSHLDGNTLSIATKTRFFQATSGEYYLGLYILEDGVMASQSGFDDDIAHHSVLRSSFSPDHFGQLIAIGEINTGMEIENTFTINLDPMWNTSNIEVVAIIWKKEGETYQFVNTNSTKELNSTSAKETIAAVAKMSINPTISATPPIVDLELTESANIQLDIFDQSGRLVAQVFNGKVQTGNHQFDLSTQPLGQGIYIARILSDKKETMAKKFVIQ